MGGKRTRLAIISVFTQSRAKDNRQRHRCPTTDAVNDGRASKIAISVPQTHGRADLRQPSAAPHPAAENWVDNGAHKDFGQQESAERNSLANSADNDIAGGFH